MTATPPSLRRARILRAPVLAAVVALALALTACSDGDDQPQGSGSTSALGSGAISGDSSPGVTATSVKVGFIIADRTALGQRLGFKTVTPGTVEVRTAGINALVAYINANGGVGGRQIEPVIRVYDSAADSPETAEALCKQFTQDDQVFAVYLDGQQQTNARPCYQAGRAIMLDSTVLAQDQQEFQNYNGYLWSATNPEYGAFVRTQLRTMAQRGFFNGSQGTALLIADNEVGRRVAEQVVKPELTAAGVTRVADYFIDSTNQGTLGATSAAALAGGASQGLDRAIAIGGARIVPVALSSAEANDWPATWGISTFDSPFNLENNKDSYVVDRFTNMVGVGYDPLADTSDPTLPFPDPANPQQVLCKQLVDQAPGAQPPQDLRANYTSILKTCDAVFFLKAVLDKAPSNLNVDSFRQAAFTVTTEYRSSLAFGSAGGPNVYAPVNLVRPLVYNQAGAFVYDGPPVPLATQ